MVTLAKAQLPAGLIQQPLAKPNTPFKGVVKCRFRADRFAQPDTEGSLQGGTKPFDLQFCRDLAILPCNSLTLQASSAYAIRKKLATTAVFALKTARAFRTLARGGLFSLQGAFAGAICH